MLCTGHLSRGRVAALRTGAQAPCQYRANPIPRTRGRVAKLQSSASRPGEECRRPRLVRIRSDNRAKIVGRLVLQRAFEATSGCHRLLKCTQPAARIFWAVAAFI